MYSITDSNTKCRQALSISVVSLIFMRLCFLLFLCTGRSYRDAANGKVTCVCLLIVALLCVRALVQLFMSHIWCKFLASKFASTITLYDVFSVLARRSNTTAGRLEAFWLLTDSSTEKQKPTQCQIHEQDATVSQKQEVVATNCLWAALLLSSYFSVDSKYTIGSR